MNKKFPMRYIVILAFFLVFMTLFSTWNQKKQSTEEIIITNSNKQANVEEKNLKQEEKPKKEGRVLSQTERLEEMKMDVIENDDENRQSFLESLEGEIEEENATVTTLVHPVVVYVFYSPSCPHCKDELKFLSKLEREMPFLTVKKYEISNDSDMTTRRVFIRLTNENKTGGSIPLTSIGENITLGFNNDNGIGAEFRAQIERCAKDGCVDPLSAEYDY